MWAAVRWVSVNEDLWSMRITDRLAQIPSTICSANWRASANLMRSSLLLSACAAFTSPVQMTVDRQIVRCLNSSSENVDRGWSVRWLMSTFISSYDDKMDDLFVLVACTVTKWPRDKSPIFGIKCISNWKNGKFAQVIAQLALAMWTVVFLRGATTHVDCGAKPVAGVIDECATVEPVLGRNARNAIVDDDVDAAVLAFDFVARLLQLCNIQRITTNRRYAIWSEPNGVRSVGVWVCVQ